MSRVSTEKRCVHCGALRDPLFFNKSKTSKSGMSNTCKACTRKDSKAWNIKNRSRNMALKMAWKSRNREKHHAHTRVCKAVKSGVLIKPDKCSKCNKTTKVQAHHEDYSKRLDVIWLCISCHELEHARLNSIIELKPQGGVK